MNPAFQLSSFPSSIHFALKVEEGELERGINSNAFKDSIAGQRDSKARHPMERRNPSADAHVKPMR